MKKILFIVLVFILCLFCVLRFNNSSEEIRIRVVPNSNSETDLKIKEKIKEEAIVFVKEIYDSNRDKMISNIENNISLFEEEINEISESKVTLENHTFYNKEYNGNVVKNENTLTLLIVIKDGKGDNWWGSIYPDLLECESSEEVEYESWFKKLFKR